MSRFVNPFVCAGRIALIAALFLSAAKVAAQNSQSDSLVILVSAKSAQAVDIEGASYRKVIGPARFLHNNTYLLCDTAFWNVDSRFIEAKGHVSLLQEQTVLTSDKLTYLIDDNLAQFRGGVVQLEDQDHNTLRTRHLDYNTADSVAVFKNGGAMRDKDGQIIESLEGIYDSKTKVFNFVNEVNMFSDTMFVKTNTLDYDTDRQTATFGTSTDMWNKDNMLSSEAGWYDRGREIFLFHRDVHLMTASQEAWSDSLYFYRVTSDVEMLGNVQITDTVRSVSALGGKAVYVDSLSSVRLLRDPVIAAQTTDQQGVVDTVYIGADSFLYYTKMRFQVDSADVEESAARLANFEVDPIGAYRKKAAEAAAKAADEEARNNDPNYRPKNAAKGGAAGGVNPGGGVPVPKSSGSGDGASAAGNDASAAVSADSTGKASMETASGAAVSGTEVSAGAADGGKKDKSSSRAGKKKSSQREKARARGREMLSGESSVEIGGAAEDSAESIAAQDSLAAVRDSLRSRTDFSGMPADSVQEAVAAEDSGESIAVADSVREAVADSISVAAADSVDVVDTAADSLVVVQDSTALADSLVNLPKDSTKVGFLEAFRNVKLYRKDMQMACDSLLYCDLDSIARLFVNPMIWQEGTRQYSADSIFVLVRNGAMDRASLMSEAFISIEEDSNHFDQIKGAEMMAYFDPQGNLSRFDVLGGASALFYLQEHDVLATVNRKESKMLTAIFKDSNIERIYYFDTAKSDGYPVVQMSEEDRKLKGFNWSPERCPSHKDSITTASLRAPQRGEYEARPQAAFTQTNIYFPGYIDNIHRQIAVRDSLKEVRRAEAERMRQLEEMQRRDSLLRAGADSIALADSLHLADSLSRRDSLALADSLSVADSLSRAELAAADSLSAADHSKTLTPEELKAKKKADEQARREEDARRKAEEKAARKAARIAAREKKWEEADSKDAAKKIARDARKLEKLRAKKRKALESAAAQARKDQQTMERYKARYEKRISRRH